ncbi:MAG: sensor domain-containing diguanylate cyclase [Clostridia bacterium]
MTKENYGRKDVDLSFKPIIKYIIFFYILVLFLETLITIGYGFRVMQKENDFALASTKSQLEYRVDNSIALLTSLAGNAYYKSPNISYEEKATQLNVYAKNLNYFMMRILDKDGNVYTEKGTTANLSSREYIQALNKTGKPQVTDAFAAGSDGITKNFTIAVPILQNGKVDGCIFASISLDEVHEMLNYNTSSSYQELLLLGSKTQAMAINVPEKYGKTFLELSQPEFFFNVQAKGIEESIYAKKPETYFSARTFDLKRNTFTPIKNTGWTLFCRVSFGKLLLTLLPRLLLMFLLSTLGCIVFVLLAKKFINSRRETVDMLVESVQELEKKIYQNEKPDNVDFKEIISLTNKGLTDGLTGVITRTVFSNQLPNKINAITPGEVAAICFVDVDNLKMINDTYGHNTGDIALKNVGYVLREYEKKYDGLVGRYGGDEFILFLSGILSTDILEDILSEIIARLHSEIHINEEVISVRCSMGVSICTSPEDNSEDLVRKADKMLYYVKQTKKGSYKIFEDTTDTNS